MLLKTQFSASEGIRFIARSSSTVKLFSPKNQSIQQTGLQHETEKIWLIHITEFLFSTCWMPL